MQHDLQFDHVIISKSFGPSDRFRGNGGSCDIYGQNSDGTLKHLPPIWTMRGWLERHDVPIHKTQYDTGIFNIPMDPAEREAFRQRCTREMWTVYQPLAAGVMGRRLEICGILIYVYIAAMPDFEGTGCVSNYLNTLPRNQ